MLHINIKSLIKGLIISVLALMLVATPVSAKQRVHHHRRILMSIVIGGNQHHASYRYSAKTRYARRTRHTYIHRNRKNTYKRSNKRLNRRQLIKLLDKLKSEENEKAKYNAKYKSYQNKRRHHKSAARIYEDTHRSRIYNRRNFRLNSSDLLVPRGRGAINNVTSQLNYWTLRDINKDRKAYHLWPLTENNQLNDLAKVRASQIRTNFNHKDSQGITYDARDASQVGMNPIIGQYMISENIMGSPLGYSAEIDDPTNYYSCNGHDLADEDENSMLNYDDDGGGHRRNILDPTSHHIGIASRYDQKDKNFYLAEEFI